MMTIKEYMQDGDRQAADEIKSEYDYLFDQVMQLYDLRDTLTENRQSNVDATRQIAEKQTRLRWLDEKLHHICRIPVAATHPDIIPLVKAPDNIWTDEDCGNGADVRVYERSEVYVPKNKAYRKPRGPYKRRKPKVDIQAIANGILNIETE